MRKLRSHSVPSIRTRRQREHRRAETLAMLRTLTIPVLLAAGGATVQAAPPSGADNAPARPAPPVAPVKYLEAGAKLFNKQKYPLAAKYLRAANDYRDQLNENERQVLDAYLEEMGKVPAELMAGDPAPSQAPAAAAEPAAAGQPPVTAAPSSMPAATASPPVAQAPVARSGGDARGPAGDDKQRARWMLQQAREMIQRGQYDEAAATIAEVRGMNVRWGLFDETPAKLAEVLATARPKAQAPATAIVHKDRKTAKAKLQQARALLAEGNYEQAEAIALDVKSWKVSYGFFDDTPNKVAAAARALRSRDVQRRWGPREQPSQGVYDLLVRESRKLLAEGKFDQAKQKAVQAQRMRVVPPLSADRAEDVLQDISLAVAKAGQGGGAVLANGAEPASVVSEREANELLARGDTQAAAAKLAEADKLRLQEQGLALGHGLVPLQGPSDPAVQRVEATSTLQPLPATGAAPAQAAPATGRGDQLLSEAQALCASGNYPAAKQLAVQAKTGGFGVDAKADEMLAQVALAEQGGALSVYEGALEAIRKGDSARARHLLEELANSGGTLDEGLSQKVHDLLAKLPQEGAGKAVATDLKNAQDAETLAAQKLNAEVGTRIAEARRLHEVDPDKAIEIYEQTIKTVKAAGIPEPLARPMVRRLEVGVELAKKDKLAFDIKMKDKAARAEIEQKRLRIFEADKAQKDRMKELMEKAMTAMAEGKYEEAEATAKLAQEVDPNDVAPGIIAFKAKMERRMKRNQKNRDDSEDAMVRSMQLVDEAAIADPQVQMDGIKYPTNFKELTERRLRMNEKLQPRKSPRTLAIEGKLNDSVTLNMDNQPLGEAIGFLANYTGLNIVLDPKALQEEGLTTASPVSLVASNIRLKTALKLLLKPMGLTYHIEDEVLLITSPQISQDQMQTQTYYVGDLIMPPGSNQQRNTGLPGGLVDPTKPINPAELQAQAAAMSGGFNSGLGNQASGTSVKNGERPNIDLTPLIQLITTSIAPGTWRVTNPDTKADESAAYGMGGGFGGGGGGDAADANQPIGSITPFMLSISLIIRHTAEIHEQVADLLRQLRRLQDLQVSIEVRFITLEDSFFEAIGVDFDFTIESKALGKHSTIAQTNPAATLFTGPTSLPTSGTTGGAGGFAGGTAGGNLGGGLGGGGLGGGGLGGGGLGGTGGAGGGLGGGASGTSIPPIIVNNIRDNTTPSTGPIIVGTQSGGIGNFTPDLTIPFSQGSATPALGGINNNVPGAGATFGIAFLSDLEVFLFLQAAQGDTRNNILQAPKVTSFNGAMAFISNTQMITYISMLFPIVGFGSVAFMPMPQQFPNGVQLSVTPVVSADRRYVRMTLSPNFTALQSFDTIQVPAAVGGGGLGGGSAAINATIQMPNFTQTTVSTTVTVPDGGTVLLGGVKRLSEQRLEFGVPVLSKVPMLNRLFRNIGIGRDTSSLMMMVTPRIVILEEEEERLGIPTIAL